MGQKKKNCCVNELNNNKTQNRMRTNILINFSGKPIFIASSLQHGSASSSMRNFSFCICIFLSLAFPLSLFHTCFIFTQPIWLTFVFCSFFCFFLFVSFCWNGFHAKRNCWRFFPLSQITIETKSKEAENGRAIDWL